MPLFSLCNIRKLSVPIGLIFCLKFSTPVWAVDQFCLSDNYIDLPFYAKKVNGEYNEGVMMAGVSALFKKAGIVIETIILPQKRCFKVMAEPRSVQKAISYQ